MPVDRVSLSVLEENRHKYEVFITHEKALI